MALWVMFRLLPILALLAACNTAGPAFRGLPATRVTVDGSTFDVRIRDRTAEAIRVNAEYAPRFGPIRDRAGRAMAQVSGCEVKSVSGDQAQAIGVLKCGKGRTPKARRSAPKASDLECVPVRGSAVQGVNQTTVEVDCYPT